MIYRDVMRSLRGLFWLLNLVVLISCGNGTKTESKEPTSTEDKSQDETEKETSQKGDDKVILFFGDSLTAGYGLDTTEAYPALIQQKLDSLDYNYNIINAGLSGDTSASGKSRIDWILKQEVDIFILELGANDGLRGIPLSETKQNLQDIIDAVRQKDNDTKIILAGMQIPPNMGPEYTSEFKNIFPQLAEKNNTLLIPFLLEGVAGNPELNQTDGIHPTAEGYEIVADNVWEVLQKVIKNE
jgi:acyl-CoA thioesterase-1